MTSSIIRSTLISTLALMVLMTIAASGASASEITGTLNSSGNDTPAPSEESAPALTGSVTGSPSGEASKSQESSASGYTPATTNPPTKEAAPETPAPGIVLGSSTHVPNVSISNSPVEYSLPLKDADTLALLNDNAAANTSFVASVATASDTTLYTWGWIAFSLFVISLMAGLYIYRPRDSEENWIGAQY